MSAPTTPTLYEWAGGREAIERLTTVFYDGILGDPDPVLEPVFRGMDREHPKHVAAWLGEVFGGPPAYTEEHGGYAHMLARHRGLALTETQRARWVQRIGPAADAAGLPADPEFRSALMAYVEWGTRLAVANSQPDAAPPPRAPVPRWGWGEAPPYRP
jgi:hemoglobin